MKKTIVILAAIVMLFALSACNPLANQLINAAKSAAAHVTSEPDPTDAEETAAPEQADATAGETTAPDSGSGLPGKVPDGIPAWIPAFNWGKYVQEGSGKLEYDGTSMFTMNYSGVTSEQMDEYCNALKNAGLDVSKVEVNGDMLITGTCVKDNMDYSALIGWKAADKTCSIVITCVAKTN